MKTKYYLIILGLLAFLVLGTAGFFYIDSAYCESIEKVDPVWPSHSRIILNLDDIRFIDGDTIEYQGKAIRFLGCDTPEKAASFFNGDQEPYATRAAEFTEEQIRAADIVALELSTYPDRYGRLLGHLFIDGESLSLLLISSAHAYETISRYGDNGFEELAEDIREAAEDIEYEFEDPHTWRRNNRR